MKKVRYRTIEGRAGYYAIVGALALVALIGVGAAWYMEHNGHWVTGMDNQTVWGLPHVFAVFLIVAASGALNTASIGTVFNRAMYKPLARMSGLLAISLLVGGLAVLVLDLGRPDRLIVAMTKYNFKSIFAWNIFLYIGFIVAVAVYLWFMMERRMNRYYRPAGFVAFIWRIVLTTGTGSIFGFLVARQGYDEAILAPMFVIMSFAFGLAAFILLLMATYSLSGRPLGDAVVARLKNLLGVFIASVLYFVAVYHLTNLYATEHHGWERFILGGGNIHSQVFWWGWIVFGSLVPLALVYSPLGRSRKWVAVASALVILGGFAAMWVTIIGGQSYPLQIFPGYEVLSSDFFDAVPYHTYTPSLPEFLLGMGGIAISLLVFVIGIRVLKFAPVSLADADVDPHHG